jgi:O-antigen ligase/Flp pilus assembly protein TadD
LGLLAFSALLFYKPLEDAYLLPQRLGLGVAALLLLAAPGSLPWGRVTQLGLAWFGWRTLCHLLAGWGPDSPGWLAWQACLLLLFIGAARALTRAEPRRFLAAALMAALALGAAFALLGPLGLDPSASSALDLGFGRRAYGSLGNPDFLGGWLALLLPLSLSVALRLPAQGRARAAAWSVTALAATALWLTQARGAWLAGAAGVALALAVLGAWRSHGWRVLSLGLLLGLAALVATGPSTWAGRLRDAADPRGGSWQGRRLMSAVCLDLARQHPVFGVGPGRFTDAFLMDQAPRLAADRAQPYRYTDDAHDDWAQAAAEAGWLGLALWAALVGGAMALAWRRGGLEGAALFGGMGALSVQSLFHFPMGIAPTQALALCGLGLAAGWDAPAERAWPAWMQALAAAALVAALALFCRQALSSACLNRGTVDAARPGAQPWAGPLLQRAAELRPDDARAWTRLGRWQVDAGRLAEAQASYRRALQCLPHLGEAWAGLALAQGMAGDLAGAEASGREAVAWDVRAAEAWSNLAKVIYLKGDHALALTVARKGLELADAGAAGYFNLAAMLYNDGHARDAIEPLREALRRQPAYPEAQALLQRCSHAR